MVPPLEVRVLGPIDIRSDERIVPQLRPQVRQVVGILAARPGRTFTVDELVDQLWPTDLPASPRRALQVAMSRLRSSLGPAAAALRLSGPNYRLDADIVDVAAHEAALAQARAASSPSEVVEVLGASLDLWRGSPFADALGPPLVDHVAVELAESGLTAATMLAEAHLAIGHVDEALAVARRWYDEEQPHERLAVILAHGLASGGRKTEALRLLESLRTTLRDNMGLDPSAAVADLEQQIIVGSVDLYDVPQPDGAAAPMPFVGRDREIAVLLRAARERLQVIVVGEAGRGKTALLGQVTDALRAEGRETISLRVEARPSRPLAPVADLVSELIDVHGASPVGSLAEAAIGRVLPSHEPDRPSQIGRSDLIVELARFVNEHARNLTIVIDDFHELDALSAAIVEEIVGAGECAVLAASRPVTPAPTHLLRLLEGDTRALILPLPELSTSDVFRYVDLRYGRRPDDRKVEEFRARSGGNPLFLSLLVDLDLEGALQDGALPTSIIVAVRERLDSLSAQAIRTMHYAAALGTRFSMAPLRKLFPSADNDIREARDARLVVPAGDDEAEFVHGLVAEAVLQMIPEGTRVTVHDQLGTLLLDAEASPLEYVMHVTEAAHLDPHRAASANLAAGEEHLKAHSLDVAIERFEKGLDLLRQHRDDDVEVTVSLQISLGRAQRLSADDAHVDTLLAAVDGARRAGSSELLAKAVVELSSHGLTTQAGQSHHVTLDLIEEALARPIPDDLRAELSAAASAATALAPDYERGQRLFREGLDLAGRLGDPETEAKVLAHAHLGLSRPTDFDRRLAAAARLRELAGDDVELGWEAAYLDFWHGFLAAAPDVMAAAMDELHELTPRTSTRRRHVSLAHLETAHAHVRGDLDAAESSLDRAFEMAREVFDESWAIAHYSGLIFAIRNSQGRLPELRDALVRFIEEMPAYPNWRPGIAIIALEAGDRDAAADELARLSPDRFAALIKDVSWTAAVFGLGRVAAALGDAENCEVLYDLLSPHAGRMSWVGTCTLGPNDTVLAELADALGDGTLAERHRETAASIEARLRGADRSSVG